ncbi:MAG: cytochrome c [Oceanicoccus sp.]
MKIKILTAGVLCALAIASAANAADTKSIIKHRQGIMEAIGGHFTAAYSSMGGMPEFNDNQVYHAESVARLSKIAVDVFPVGSGDGKTKANAAVWDNADDFKAKMDDFLIKADEFAAASKSGDMASYGAATKALGGSCKGCHDDFKDK